jgi:hypothetical protein
MYASVRRPHVFDVHSARWLARASAAILVVTWLALVMAEAVRSRFETPSLESLYQAAVFGIVFAGYAIGLRKELAGGVIAIVGTVAFFAVYLMTLGGLPHLAAALFAAPGVLYLMAWYNDLAPGAGVARQP